MSEDKKKPKTPRVPLSERLSKREIEHLMDMHKPTYKRVNGKVKRK